MLLTTPIDACGGFHGSPGPLVYFTLKNGFSKTLPPDDVPKVEEPEEPEDPIPVPEVRPVPPAGAPVEFELEFCAGVGVTVALALAVGVEVGVTVPVGGFVTRVQPSVSPLPL